MRTEGKIAKHWRAYRKEWKERHPANHQGNYECGICGRYVSADVMVLDHIQPRSRRPDLRFEDSNIQPAHHFCNGKKGSRIL